MQKVNIAPRHNGFAIALAWPQTYCKQPGSWYDLPTHLLGISHNRYYKVGHAAVVLIDSMGNAHYFDFGRYHTRFGHGRVRGANTDNELRVQTKAKISPDGKYIINYQEILNELQQNKACHGEGELYSSYCHIDFYAALNEVIRLQKSVEIKYGPFLLNGCNCSRFVNKAIKAGNPDLKHWFKLKYLQLFTPTPINNINSLDNKRITLSYSKSPLHQPARLNKKALKTTLCQPSQPNGIPANAQWLAGEGAGSWFAFSHKKDAIAVTKYSPGGQMECQGLFRINKTHTHFLSDDYKVHYPSNCKIVTLLQGNQIIELHRIS